MSESVKPSWIITLSGDRKIHEVASDLKAAGFEVAEVLEAIGVVTGWGQQSVVERIRQVRGVADVSLDRSVDIGPPDAPVS